MVARSPSAWQGELDVLSISATAEPWGAELALLTYLQHRPAGFASRVLCLSEGPLEDKLMKAGIPTAAARLAGRPSVRQASRFVGRLYSDLRRSPPDVIHATGNKAGILAAPAAAAAGVPMLWQRVDLALGRAQLRSLASVTAGVVAVSEAATRGVPAGRLLGVVPPPVRLAEDFRVPADRPPATIGSIGQLHPVKGHHDVLAAAALLRDEFENLRVIIAGGMHPAFPDYPEELQGLASRLGIADRVELTGHVDEIEGVYAQLTVLASGTYRDRSGVGPEALGAAIAEASWAGLPVVATVGGGTAEVISGGVSGTLVQPRSTPAMSAAIATYLRSPEAAAEAGEAGAAIARERFRPQQLSARLFEIIDRVAGRRTARV